MVEWAVDQGLVDGVDSWLRTAETRISDAQRGDIGRTPDLALSRRSAHDSRNRYLSRPKRTSGPRCHAVFRIGGRLSSPNEVSTERHDSGLKRHLALISNICLSASNIESLIATGLLLSSICTSHHCCTVIYHSKLNISPNVGKSK